MIYKNQYKSFIGNIITLPHTVKDPGALSKRHPNCAIS